jgi:hypothetical protein
MYVYVNVCLYQVGGRNTVLERAVMKNLPFVSDTPTIIFGADVTHPAAGEDSSASIAAVSSCSLYIYCCFIHMLLCEILRLWLVPFELMISK